MALRFLLVSLVAGMGFELPSGQELSAWARAGRDWVERADGRPFRRSGSRPSGPSWRDRLRAGRRGPGRPRPSTPGLRPPTSPSTWWSRGWPRTSPPTWPRSGPIGRSRPSLADAVAEEPGARPRRSWPGPTPSRTRRRRRRSRRDRAVDRGPGDRRPGRAALRRRPADPAGRRRLGLADRAVPSRAADGPPTRADADRRRSRPDAGRPGDPGRLARVSKARIRSDRAGRARPRGTASSSSVGSSSSTRKPLR